MFFRKIHIGMTNIVNKKRLLDKMQNLQNRHENTLINILTTHVYLVRNNILKMKKEITIEQVIPMAFENIINPCNREIIICNLIYFGNLLKWI